jgi:glycerol-3-phosphate cytidylyltransferase
MKTDAKIVGYADLPKLRDKFAKEGKTTVFTSGCYDILHLGHIIHFNFCKQKGDILFISLGNDACVRELKGPTRPINNERFRARMLAALEIVDYVVISEEMGVMDHDRMVAELRPNLYIVPGTDKRIAEKRALVEQNGGRLIACRRLPPNNLKGGISTTSIESKLIQ